MRARAIILATIPLLGISATLCGCDGPSLLEDGGVDTGPSGDPHAILLGTVDAQAACNLAGIVEVVIRATIVGCDPPPPAPCTLPADPMPVEGDRLSCPSAEAEVMLGVDVLRSGQWRVEAAYRYATGPDVLECYVRPNTTEPYVVVTGADIDEVAEIALVPTGGPCPGG